MTSLRNRIAEGTPQRWLTAAAMLLALAMIAGLVGVVVEVATKFFWPAPLWEVTLADGSRLLGEEWGREPDPRTANGERFRLKVGNRDLTGADFVWVREAEVTARRRPADAWLVERREYGAFLGYARRLELPQDSVGASDATFRKRLADLVDASAAVVAEEDATLEALGHAHEPVSRLELRLAGAQARGETTAGIEERLAAARRSEQVTIVPLLQQLTTARTRLGEGRLVLATAAGGEHAVPLAAIVRAVPSNDLATGEKVRLYLARWWEFLAAEPRESNTEGGIFPALFGTALMVVLMALIVVPFGVIAAVYLNEYAKESFFTNAVRLALANLAGVPSIVFGAFGLAFFVYTVGGSLDRLLFSDVLPTPTFGTGGILWVSLTLALLTVPVVVVATEEGLQSVPQAVRDGARALGATRWQTLRRVVLPYAAPGILTGAILAVARAAGEVAPLMVTGVVKLAPSLPLDAVPPFLHLERKFMHLGFHIYDVGFQSPNVEAAKPMVFATVLVLIVLVVVLNVTAVTLRNRLRRKLRSAAV